MRRISWRTSVDAFGFHDNCLIRHNWLCKDENLRICVNCDLIQGWSPSRKRWIPFHDLIVHGYDDNRWFRAWNIHGYYPEREDFN
ncbi:MAG: hypothetical protein EOP84_03740 [Verrucomicrobiaceae bacterium]|nr:MAG: hypothetical protein EOP84_03740 [Verrucomicrobiaceae bacterium]